MGTKVKICGLKSEMEINFANILKPDFVGFIFAKESRRYVSPDVAAKLRMKLLPSVITVGVFVNEQFEKAVSIIKMGAIDIVQLHGSESDDYITSLRQVIRKPVIKAFRIDSPKEVITASGSAADYVLLDNGGGGTGKVFDWTLASGLNRPFFLAGGLDPENVRTAIAIAGPYAVDVSSGVEIEGVKDFEKMQKFIEAVRGEQK